MCGFKFTTRTYNLIVRRESSSRT